MAIGDPCQPRVQWKSLQSGMAWQIWGLSFIERNFDSKKDRFMALGKYHTLRMNPGLKWHNSARRIFNWRWQRQVVPLKSKNLPALLKFLTRFNTFSSTNKSLNFILESFPTILPSCYCRNEIIFRRYQFSHGSGSWDEEVRRICHF